LDIILKNEVGLELLKDEVVLLRRVVYGAYSVLGGVEEVV